MKNRVVRALGPVAVTALVSTLGASCRYVVGRPERLDWLLANGPVVLALWHEHAFVAASFVHRRLHRGGLPLSVIASQSRDGELVARFAARLGVPVVRGSTSRGGRAAMLAFYRSLVKDRRSSVMLPDGPRGPRRVAKAGAVLLAQLAQVPLVPLTFAPERCATLRSWDRMAVPRPWTRVAVAIGEPRRLPRQLDAEGLEIERVRLEATLNELETEARAALRPGSDETECRGEAGARSEAGSKARPEGRVTLPEGMHEKKPV